MSKTLLPIVLDTAMSPRPAAKHDGGLQVEASTTYFFIQEIKNTFPNLPYLVGKLLCFVEHTDRPGEAVSFGKSKHTENILHINTESDELKLCSTAKGTDSILFEKFTLLTK